MYDKNKFIMNPTFDLLIYLFIYLFIYFDAFMTPATGLSSTAPLMPHLRVDRGYRSHIEPSAVIWLDEASLKNC